AFAAGIFVFTATLTFAAAPPTTHTVTNANDSGSGSLRATLAASNTGDKIVFDPTLAGQTITLTTNDPSTIGQTATVPPGPTALVVDGIAITIDGSAAPGLVISGNDTQRVLAVTNGGTLSLTNLTLSNGLAKGGNGGAAAGDGGSGCASGGGAGGFGGALYVD